MVKLISEHRTPRAWLLLSFGDNRQHAGNLGYADEISKVYYYDSFVPNCRQLAEGDLVLLQDKDQLLGVARIEVISSYQEPKPLSRCASCNTTKIKERLKKKPVFRCTLCHHEFDTPIIEYKPCEKFIADFGDTFVKAEGTIKIKELRQACPKYNGQFSMQLINLLQIESMLFKNAPTVTKLINKNNNFKYIKANDADDNENRDEYVIREEDSRETIFRQIKERRGQSTFRNLLRQRYGDQCMISGLKLLDVLEAAHISPYRGVDDNHPDNGLLLRTDLHTLFDLDLLGINPQSLEVKFHPKVMETGYQKLEGRRLKYSKYKPSQSALESRWKQFLNRLNEDD
ncbi:HNH endonuclease [Nostoc sp.]|uniref:HNH endonuclease n=1 Tax=Nostoc sp. TaxID=1180 RepID=UPI002FF5C193